jgi:hypothetical protein
LTGGRPLSIILVKGKVFKMVTKTRTAPSVGTAPATGDLIARVRGAIAANPERDELVRDTRRKIKAGGYNPDATAVAEGLMAEATERANA